MAENLEDLLNLPLAPEDRRQLVEARKEIQVGGDLRQRRWQGETLFQALGAQFAVADVRLDSRHDHRGVDTRPSAERRRNPVRLFEQREQQICGVDERAPRAAGTVKRQLDDELGRGIGTHCPVRRGRPPQLFVNGVNRLLRVHGGQAHRAREQIPIGLSDGEK